MLAAMTAVIAAERRALKSTASVLGRRRLDARFDALILGRPRVLCVSGPDASRQRGPIYGLFIGR